jgi:hypothetical protein
MLVCLQESKNKIHLFQRAQKNRGHVLGFHHTIGNLMQYLMGSLTLIVTTHTSLETNLTYYCVGAGAVRGPAQVRQKKKIYIYSLAEKKETRKKKEKKKGVFRARQTEGRRREKERSRRER